MPVSSELPEQRKKRKAAIQRAYYARSKDKQKAYYTRPDVVAKRTRQQAIRRKLNPEAYKVRANRWWAHKYATDPAFRIMWSLRCRLSRILAGRRSDTTALVTCGCTRDALVQHLEAQFQPGMTWENHGAWHIDHIRPLASFDLTDHAQRTAANHFSNLRPLWAKVNIDKGAKYDC